MLISLKLEDLHLGVFFSPLTVAFIAIGKVTTSLLLIKRINKNVRGLSLQALASIFNKRILVGSQCAIHAN